MAEKLNIQNINEQHSQYDELFTITLNMNGKDWELKANRYFNKSGIDNIVQTVIKNFQFKRESMEKILIPYLYILLIKQFTDLEVPDDLIGQVDFLGKLIDLNIFSPIINSFPKDQMKLFFEEVNEFSKSLNENMDGLLEEVENMEIENDEVKDMIERDLS